MPIQLTLFFFINKLFRLVDDFTLQFYAKQNTPQESKVQNLGVSGRGEKPSWGETKSSGTCTWGILISLRG